MFGACLVASVRENATVGIYVTCGGRPKVDPLAEPPTANTGWATRPGFKGWPASQTWVVDSTLQLSTSSCHVISRSRDPKKKTGAMRPKE